MILITGATGVVGSRLLTALGARDDVRALARSESSAAALADAAVEVVRGDLERPDTLAPAFDGVKKLFLLTPYSLGQAEQEHNALDAAERAGVERVVKLSVIGADWDIAVSHAHKAIEARLANSSFQTTVLRPENFATNFLGVLPTALAGQIHYPAGDVRLAHIDPRDIAEVAAEALTRAESLGGTYTLTGPETMTFGEVAERMGRALERPVEYLDVPPAAWREGLVGAGVPEFYADALTEMFGAIVRGGGSTVTDAVPMVLGRPARSLDTYFADELVPAARAAAAA